MQKVITIRASQSGLEKHLSHYLNAGWKIVSTTRGSEWGRVLNTYRWTVILEKDDVNSSNKLGSTADELLKAKRLLDSGAISEEEYQKLKDKILNR